MATTLVRALVVKSTRLRGHYSTWRNRNSGAAAYRCVYDPVEPDYVPPAESTCETGCFAATVDNGVETTMWIDNRSWGQNGEFSWIPTVGRTAIRPV